MTSKKVWITVGGSNRKYKKHRDLLVQNNIEFGFMGPVSLGSRSKRYILSIKEGDLEKAQKLGFSKSRQQPFQQDYSDG